MATSTTADPAAQHEEPNYLEAKRGLKNHRKTPDALDELKLEANISVFVRHGVLSAAEVNSRFNIHAEQYVKAAEIESDLLAHMVDGSVLPAAYDELHRLMGLPVTERRMKAVTALCEKIQAGRDALDAAWERVHHSADHAHAVVDEVLPVMETLRAAVDELEGQVGDDLWTLPKYREMLMPLV